MSPAKSDEKVNLPRGFYSLWRGGTSGLYINYSPVSMYDTSKSNPIELPPILCSEILKFAQDEQRKNVTNALKNLGFNIQNDFDSDAYGCPTLDYSKPL